MVNPANLVTKCNLSKILPLVMIIALVTYTVLTSSKNNKNLSDESYHEQFSEAEFKRMENESVTIKENLIAQYFFNPDKTWTKEEMFPIVLEYLIREKIEDILDLRNQFEKNPNKLTEHDLGILASAYVVNHFLEKSYSGKFIKYFK